MKRITSALLILLSMSGAYAHGDDEHADEATAAATHSHALSDRPRAEAVSESYEIMASLEEEELSILIDLFASNEPVLGAKVEVELEGIKANATFHADHGDYAVTEPKVLAALNKPGTHALVFHIEQGTEMDLLSGTLDVHEDEDIDERSWGMGAGIGFVLLLLMAVGFVLKRRASKGTQA